MPEKTLLFRDVDGDRDETSFWLNEDGDLTIYQDFFGETDSVFVTADQVRRLCEILSRRGQCGN